ncbi:MULTISPECIES: sensor histidine kinase [Vibrio]|uniref:C4-dicarboxylate transport sensor protein DctB n=3 Tax=Vibrio casei TaxID=673372 RepID=A0A368LLZ6_9VIBR|nr:MULTISPECIES: ATP-binding protein [Vibrio]RCS72914.1 sensor histidine kinase [Vibrio casei]SJN32332.1 Signal transduction histidine kinase regulating C4-dicarboxylate transport system [Vibrio casei]HBV75299.1 sensor histidine kinase [Vibrio sp.]
MRKPKRFIVVSFILYFSVAICAVFFSWQHYYQSRLKASDLQLQQFSQHFLTQIEKYAFIPQLLAQNKRLTNTLLDIENTSQLNNTNRYLEQINQLVNTSDIYLIDQKGNTIAASNWQERVTFIGQNFTFRPYFQVAISGQNSQYFALGSMSGLRGYYYSSPIVHHTEIIGVVVVKIQLSTIEDNWNDTQNSFVVSDNNHIVMMTNQDEWLYKSLIHLPEEQLLKIRRGQRYLDKDISSLDFMGDINTNPVEITINKKPSLFNGFLSISQYLPKQDLNVRILIPKMLILWDVLNVLLTLTLVSILLFLVVMFYRQRKSRLLQIERIRSQAKQELEFQVLERTSELHGEIRTRIDTENTLRRTQNELIQTAKLAVLGQMSASISHELNNPLAAIRSFSDNARQFLLKQDNEKVQQNLERISDLTVRMAKISQQLKHFAQRTSTHDLINSSINAVIKSADELMQPELKVHNVTLQLLIPAQTVTAKINTIALEQVLINTITNAIHAVSGQHSKIIELELLEQKGHVLIHIRDNGCGISHEQLDHLFEPFYTSKQNGLGLGLSISQQIMQSMKGSISAKNKEAGGAQFTLTIPKNGKPSNIDPTNNNIPP